MQLAPNSVAFILQSFAVNILLAVLALPIAIAVAALFAYGRMSRFKPIYYFVTLYVNVLRSMPLIMVMFWLYFLAPILLGREVGAFNSALIALVIFEIAYFHRDYSRRHSINSSRSKVCGTLKWHATLAGSDTGHPPAGDQAYVALTHHSKHYRVSGHDTRQRDRRSRH